MIPLASFLISTRNRPALLKKCVQSLISTASDIMAFEVVLRMGFDDFETQKVLPELMSMCVCRTIISWPLDGYNSVPWFAQEMSRLACGKWSWLLGDDCELKGSDWIYHLTGLPDIVSVQPEWNQLNTSGYQHVKHGPFVCLPTWWLQKHAPELSLPLDKCIENILTKQKIQTCFIPELKIIHHNPPPSELVHERAMDKWTSGQLTYLRPDMKMGAIKTKTEPVPIAHMPVRIYDPHDRSHGRIQVSPGMRRK